MTADKIKRLENIGFVWNPKQKIWDDTFNLLNAYIAENHKLPSRHTKIGKTALGQWYAKQIKAYNERALDDHKCKKLESLQIPLKKSDGVINENFWNEKYNEVLDYVNQNNCLPNTKETDLYNWLVLQKVLPKIRLAER